MMEPKHKITSVT